MIWTQEIEIYLKLLEGSKVYHLEQLIQFNQDNVETEPPSRLPRMRYLPLDYLDLIVRPHTLAAIAAAHVQGSETDSIAKRVGSYISSKTVIVIQLPILLGTLHATVSLYYSVRV